MNNIQKIVLETYSDGEFADYTDVEEARDTCGDMLFSFLLTELSDDEDCETTEDAIRRLHTAVDDIQTVIDALEGV